MLLTLYLQCQASSVASLLCLLGFYFPVAMLCSPCCHDVVMTAFSSQSSSSSLKTCVICFLVDLLLQVVGVDKEVVGCCAVLFFIFVSSVM